MTYERTREKSLVDFDWHEDGVVDELKRLHDDGDSAQKMAYELTRKFGGILTRSAILGKLNRLGLSVPAKPSKRPRRDRKRNVISPLTGQPKRNRDFGTPTLESYTTPAIELSAAEIPIKQRKQILELKDDDCRWPYGDVGKPDFFFCGARTEEGMPYCRKHCRISYQPMGARWRDRQAA